MAQSGVCSEVGIMFGIMAPNPTIPHSPFPNITIVESYLPKNVVFHQRLSSMEDRLPWKVVFHGRLSSAPELPTSSPKVNQAELGHLDNKLNGTDRQTDRTTY